MRHITFCISFLTLLMVSSGSAFGQDPLAAIQKKLISDYPLTQATADYTDIVTAGAVLKLQKSNLVMPPVADRDVCQNTYKGGQIKQNILCHKVPRWPGLGSSASSNNRTFVTGETMWVTKIDVRDDGIFFDLLSDPFSDVRYKATLKFPLAKGSTPSVDEAEKLVAEVFTVQPQDDAKTQGQQQGGQAQAGPSAGGPSAAPAPAPAPAAPAPAAAAAPPPPIAPPPPPTDQQPATISLGMSPDQVVANLGQPQKQVKLGTKLIYMYKDMKVTFVNNKVTDVQ